jgi:hypothetical protein
LRQAQAAAKGLVPVLVWCALVRDALTAAVILIPVGFIVVEGDTITDLRSTLAAACFVVKDILAAISW